MRIKTLLKNKNQCFVSLPHNPQRASIILPLPLHEIPLIQRTHQVHPAGALAIEDALFEGGVHRSQAGLVGTGGCALVVLDLDALEHAGVVVGFVRDLLLVGWCWWWV